VRSEKEKSSGIKKEITGQLKDMKKQTIQRKVGNTFYFNPDSWGSEEDLKL
jgi:hypothetical protein